jgi:heat shock protein beta
MASALLRGVSSRVSQVRSEQRSVAPVNISAIRQISSSPIAVPFSAKKHAFGTRKITTCRAAAAEEETFQYQAEVDRLMDMIVHSLYSNREVFLRELISNASDALDKIRFISLTNPDSVKGREELEIKISCDKEKKTITIEDAGLGMTREQLLSNLGTIARSGTRKFMEAMQEAKGDSNLIGQFGVGFYSAFLVAEKVQVQTKSFEEDKQWVWSANADSHEYKVREDSVKDLVRGTRITLFLKDDAHDFADPPRLSKLIKQYSQFISFPIKLYSPKKEPRKVVDEEATKRKQEQADKKAAEAGEESKKVDPVTKTEYDEVWDWRVENENKPIWTRNPKDVSDESYNEFFKTTFQEFIDPLAHVHFNVEGTIEFSAIMYVPGMAPFEQQNMMSKSRSIKLYVKRVFISDEFDDDLMPRYLSFVKGVVDSSDLPLNVSREILQESRIVRVIRKQLVRRTLEMIDELASKEDSEDYKTFWENFGRNIKIGVIEDEENRKKLAKLLRFNSSAAIDAPTRSLDQYVSSMKSGQKSIYYMAGDSVLAASSAPFVEKLVKKGYEVLYLTEAIDEATIQNLGKFEDFELVDVSREGLELEEDEADKKKLEQWTSEFKDVTDFLKKTLDSRVEKVTVSNRLTDSPCVLSTSKFGWSANMERIMRTQAMGDSRSMEYMKGRKTMEINPEHEIVQGLKQLLQEKDEDRAKDLSELLYETALLTSGFQVDSPREYATKVFTLMKIALGYDATAAPEPSASSSSAAAAPSTPAQPAVQKVEAEIVSDDPWKP